MTLTPEQMAGIEKRHADIQEYYEQLARDAGFVSSTTGPQVHDDRAALLAHARDLERQLSERRAADREAIKQAVVATILRYAGQYGETRDTLSEWIVDAIIALQSTPPEGAK